MVHGELIKQGKVQKLTFKQLEKLEKIDATKERRRLRLEHKQEMEKIVGQAFIGAGTAAIYTVGEIAKTSLEGVFKVGAAAAGASPISQGVDALATLLIVTWINTYYPNLAKFFHLDAFPGLPGGGSIIVNPPPGTAAGTPSTGQTVGPGTVPGQFKIVPTGVNIFSLPKDVLKTATQKALNNDISGCMATLSSAGADTQEALQYCSNTAVGVAQL